MILTLNWHLPVLRISEQVRHSHMSIRKISDLDEFRIWSLAIPVVPHSPYNSNLNWIWTRVINKYRKLFFSRRVPPTLLPRHCSWWIENWMKFTHIWVKLRLIWHFTHLFLKQRVSLILRNSVVILTVRKAAFFLLKWKFSKQFKEHHLATPNSFHAKKNDLATTLSANIYAKGILNDTS